MVKSIGITVVVCVHTLDRLRNIRDTVAALKAQTHIWHSLVIVCDHSDALYAVLKSEFPSTTIVKNSFEKGLSGARNTGILQSRGEVIAFLDDDATAEPDWLEKIAATYADPNVMAVGGFIEPAWEHGRPAWFPQEFDWVVGCSYLGLPRERTEVRNLIGCNMSVRRSALRQTGGFRTDLGRNGENAAGCEETEFFIRIKTKLARERVVYEPEARVHHHVPASRSTWKYFFARCWAEGKSKASMVRLVGSQSGLSSESEYAARTLPAGIFRNFREAVRGDPGGIARAFALLSGLTVTATSYFLEKHRPAVSKRTKETFLPMQIVDWNLDRQDAATLLSSLKSPSFPGGALCLFRSKGDPVAVREIHLEDLEPDTARFGDIENSTRTAFRSPLLRMPLGPDRPWVTVVIATRERADSLFRCLNSLLVQTYSAMDIVVVDNAPKSQATHDLVTCLFAGSGRVQYVREDRPGLAIAHNAGLKRALGDIVAFTDDDVLVDPDWVAAIACEFAQSRETGCVTGMILPAELQTRAQYWTERHGGFGKGVVRRVFDIKSNRPDDPLFPFNAGTFGSGANMAFSREALLKIGGFNAALGAGTPARGGDDLASFAAVLEAGFKLVYEPRAIVWHFHRRGESGLRRQAYGYGVGLGAYLTSLVVSHPRNLITFAGKLPAGFAHLCGASSPKMQRLPQDYPRHLVWRERLGIVMGVPAYLRSKLSARRSSTPPNTRPLLTGLNRSLE